MNDRYLYRAKRMDNCEFISGRAASMLQAGDTIQCSDADDMICMSEILAKKGIMTDFQFEKNGNKGYGLIVVDHF